MRPLLITCCGTALAGTAAWSLVGMVAMGSSHTHGSGHLLPKPQLYLTERSKDRPWDKHARVGPAQKLVAAAASEPPTFASLSASEAKSGRSYVLPAEVDATASRFDALAKQAGLTPELLVSRFKHTAAAKSLQASAKFEVPAPERFGPPVSGSTDKPLTQLAYATPAQSGATGAAFSAVLTAPIEDDVAASPEPSVDDEAAALPDYENTPSSGPLPQSRPRDEQVQKPDVAAEKPASKPAEEAVAAKAEEADKADKPDERETPKQKVAFVRPDDPAKSSAGTGFGQALRNMFGGGAKAGNGVAVYDITAAKVYMPDGTVLEAHSGIGKMADNPRYVDVKMTGPTPPHTYNLKMRETRFHGVEAIRMLPIDGKNKHGRDGFLTHSYLLRGGRAESHGCVAFKDYARFLTAFKQGKVRQIVVVPSGGRAAGTRIASNGRSS
ncbi:MAG TPA: tlde1 domain-containing protein [Ensifer sp.]|uniref:tlde1 domain-containing protein n=1 Tax=Ensifer sp. TaxID=1872086 RepID=UPI002E12CD9B|nr:tlde1 domain-containing protein [Ensifer sp.]